MKRTNPLLMSRLHLAGAALLMGWPITSAFAQSPNEGIIDDWTSHHVIFSDPGTRMDAMKNGRFQEWQRIVNNPRYRMQQKRRGLPMAGETATSTVDPPSASEAVPPNLIVKGQIANLGQNLQNVPLDPNWPVTLSSTANQGVALGVYPAKYSLAVGTEQCSDYVVFPINASGSTSQANLLGVFNLYAGTCTKLPNVPTVLFAYNVGTGKVQTSPDISLDGTKVTFVESGGTGGAIFHVLTLPANIELGNAGCSTGGSPCNGATAATPVAPCHVVTNGTATTCTTGINDATDTRISLPGQFGGGAAVTRSSPYVDYESDTAYIGDDSGQVHKITGVFKGTPTYVAGSGRPSWAVTSANTSLSSPVFDSVSQHVFAGGVNGNLWCFAAPSGAACTTPSIPVGGGGNQIYASPIVDSTTQRVFVTANESGVSTLTQATTNLGAPVNVNMGAQGGNPVLYNGAFDNAYFTSIGTGHMYFCGNGTSGSTGIPTLYRVGFNGSGVMNGTRDTSSFQLEASAPGSGLGCTPLIDVVNSSTEHLFVGVGANGFTSSTAPTGPNCGGATCVISFVIPSSGSFPTAANATTQVTPGGSGLSAIIIDNVSGATGASNIYLGNVANSTGLQLSQSTLLLQP